MGGEYGRVIHFSNGDFSVYQRKIGHNRSRQLATRDRECWQRAIDIQEYALPEVELWL